MRSRLRYLHSFVLLNVNSHAVYEKLIVQFRVKSIIQILVFLYLR
jgi:hypothetical protein